jgi:hypothetical protein
MTCRLLRLTLVPALALALAWSTTEASAQQELLAQSEHQLPAEQDAFWASILELCGQAFERVDALYVMHVRQCYPDEIRIPVHVGDEEDGTWNRSRTWILTRTPDGIRLKHDHRYEDGSEEETTQYGGDTDEVGSAGIQTFPADEFTREVIGELVRGAENNIWRMEITPGEDFSYRLTRSTFDNALRWAFDLTNPVDPPPAPWGYEDTEPTHGPDGP